VLRLEAGIPSIPADIRDLHRLSERAGQGEGRAQDLAPALSIGAVDMHHAGIGRAVHILRSSGREFFAQQPALAGPSVRIKGSSFLLLRGNGGPGRWKSSRFVLLLPL
jgi:hypothetical protein